MKLELFVLELLEQLEYSAPPYSSYVNFFCELIFYADRSKQIFILSLVKVMLY